MIKRIGWALLVIFVAIIAGTALMIAVYGIPVDNIRDNIRYAQPLLAKEGDYYSWAPGIFNSLLDMNTDAIMLGSASFPGTDSCIQDAMLNPRIVFSDVPSSMEILLMDISGDNPEERKFVSYGRYWHGYLILLKPLLFFFTLSDVLVLNMCIQLVLLMLVLIELKEKQGMKYAVVLLVTVFTINPLSTIMCMQFSNVYITTLVSLLIILKYRVYERYTYDFLFLGIGIATAFFDVLTYPVVDLGVPLLFLLVLRRDSIAEDLKCVVRSSLAWGGGYAGMWGGKWIVASVLTGENIFIDGLESVIYRMSSNASEEIGIKTLSSTEVIGRNIQFFVNTPGYTIFFVCVISISFLILTKKIRFRFEKKVFVYFIVGAYPFLWYCLVKNHSMVHCWMTQRDLSIALCAALCCAAEMLEWKKEKT